MDVYDKEWFNPLTAEWALWALIDFTRSNARRFYSSMGNPLAGKRLKMEKPTDGEMEVLYHTKASCIRA